MSQIALLAGATGLIGSSLLRRLLDDPAYAQVKVLTRRPLALTHPRLLPIYTDLTTVSELGATLSADVVFCCLGTTRRKAGSKAAFERVDYHMVVDLARAAHGAGARRFLVVSSLGASPRSPSFYARVKGRMELALRDIGFDTLHILRPSLLLGSRSERRPAEELAQRLAPAVAPLFRGRWLPYRPVPADEVAEALQRLAARRDSGAHIHTLPLAA
ncbi:MAG TPA: NAD(P)H-binding protein [Nevskiaceae bacterium]|nr:NAD(P)H-binding protein [Nevskiaceae bacterium]